MKLLHKTLIITISFIMLGAFTLPHSIFAQTVSYPSPPKDSDYDGLTDQGEIQVYGSDPQNPDSDNDGYLDGAEVLANTSPTDANSPSSTDETIVSTNEVEIPWPWYISRASAIAAYLLLFLLIISGILIKTSIAFRFLSPTTAWVNHRLIALSLSFTVLIHISSLLFDKYAKFTVADLLIPFSTNFKPLYVALGIIGLYLLIIIMISSIYYIDKHPKIWRRLHYLTYPLFILIAFHGFFAGTDSGTALMQIIYLSTGIISGLLMLYRIYFHYRQV